METGVIIQEPVFAKTNVEEAPAGDHSSMDVNKVNLSTVLDDEIKSPGFGNNIIPVEAAEIVNGSGNKETEEAEREKGKVMKTVSVVEDDDKIVREKASETENHEQSFTYVHEPESFNKNREDSEKTLSDVTLEKAKEAHFTPKPEEVSVEKPVKEEETSRTVETSVNVTEAEHKETVSVEETAPEDETATNGESLLDVETKKRVLLEAEQDAEPRLDAQAKDETETIKTVIEDHGIVSSEETSVHESESSKESVNSVEAVKNSDDAEKISREVTVDREKEEDVTPKQEEVQECLTVNESPTIQGEDFESKASKDTKEQEHVLVRDTPQGETVNTSTVQESPILRTLETRIDEPVSETSTLDLKEVKEQEVETVKTVKSSDEVQESIMVDQISKATEEDEHVLVKNMPQGDMFVTEADTLEAKEDTEPIMDLKEDKEQVETEKFEETASDLALKLDKEEVKDDKINADQVDGGQIMEQQRGLDSKEPEAEQTDRNRTDETEEKMFSYPVTESVKEIEKPSLEPPSEVSEETSKTIDEKNEEKPEEHQEGHEEGSYGLETQKETVSVPKSIELGDTVLEERSVVDLTPLQDESSLRKEQEKETKFEKEQIEKHEEVKSDEVIEHSRTAETSVNGTEIEQNATVSAEEISKNTVNETTPEDDHQGKNAEPVEAIKDSDDAEIISYDVATEREKEDDIIRKAEEVQESPTVIETPKIQGENTESKASKDTEEQEHVLVRDTPQIETIKTEAGAVSTSPVQEATILKTLETTTNETEAGQVTEEDTKPSLDLKEDQETEKTETVKPVISSDEVRPSDQVDVPAEESVEVKSKENVQGESSEEKHENLLDVPSEESEKFQDNESETVLVAKIPSDLALKVDEEEVKDEKTEVDKVDGTHLMEEQRGLDLTETEAEQTEGNRTNETEETSFEKVVAVEADEKITHDQALPDVESVEKMQNLSSLESPSEELGETSKTVDEKIDEAENNATVVPVEEISRNIVNETAPEDDDHQGEKAEPVVSGDREKEEDIAGITDEVQETPKVIETPKTEGDWSESKDSKDDEQHENLLVKDMPQVETLVTEAEIVQDTSKVQESAILETEIDETKAVQEESSGKNKNLLDEKTSVDQVDGTQIMEEQKGLHLKDPEAEQTDGNRTDETEVSPTVEAEETTHAQAPLDVESVETVQKRSLESPSEVSEETSKTVDEKIEEKPKVEEVTQVSSSASPSEERESETVVEDRKVDEEEEKVADKIQKSLETVETDESHSSLPSSSEEKEHEIVSEKIEEEKVEEEQKSEDDTTKSHERQEELSETTVVEAEKTRDMGSSLSENISLDQTQAEEQVRDDEHVDSPTSLMLSEKSDDENLTAEAKKGDEKTTARDIPQGETIVTEAEPVEDTSTVQESPILKTLETKIDETEAVHSPIGEEEESQVAKENTQPIMDVKEDKEQEVTETVKSVISSDEVRSSDAQVQEIGEHTEHCSAEIKDESQGREEYVDVKPKEIIQEESTQEKDENLLDVPSGESALGSASELSEETSQTVDEKIEAKPEEEEVTLHQESHEEEKETNLEKEQTEKHESTSEEDANAQQNPAAEKSDEVIQVSSASPSEEKESETVEAEKIGDIKENEEEQVADKIQRSLEPVEKVEPNISFPSPPEEHSTVAEGVKVKETEPVGDMSEKGLEVSETKDLSLPLEASRSDGTESSELVAEPEEQKPKQVKEILEGERKEVDETKAETIPQETHSDVAKEEQTRELHVEQEVISSAEKGETKSKEPEDEHVESSEKNDDGTLIAETKKEDEDITVGVDGSGTKQEEEFENLEAPKLEESEEDKNQEVSETTEAVEAKGDHTLAIGTSEASQTPSFISELEDQIPKQIEEIHEEETKEAHKVEATSDQDLPVETSEAHQTKKRIEEIHEEETKAHELQEEEEVLPTETVPREVSLLASGEDDQVAVQEGNSAGDTPEEEHHVSAETEESVGETKPKESEAEITEKLDDQIETSTKATKVEDEDTKKTDVEVAEITKEQNMPHAPENAPLKQEELKDLETPQQDVVKEVQSPVRNDNPDDTTVEAEHGDENSSTLPVVEILKGLQATLETERAINDSESTEENMVTEPEAQKTDDAEVEPETLEKNLATDISEPVPEEKQDEKVVEESPASEIKEANTLQKDESGETEKIKEVNSLANNSRQVEVKLQEEHKEKGNVQDRISREFEVDEEEKLQEETKEIADRSLTEVVPGEKILIPSSDLSTEESEHVVSAEKQEEVNAQKSEKQEEVNAQKGANDSITETEQITLQEEKKAETHETVKEDQSFDIKEEKKIEEVQDQKVEGLSVTRDEEETFRSEMKKDKEDAINEVAISEKQITEPPSEAEKESNEEDVESQAISEDNSLTKEALDEQLQVPSTEISKPSELIQSHQSPKQVEKEDKNEKTVDALVTSENVLVQDQSKDFEQDKESNDLTYVQGENVTNDSVVAQKEATGLTEEKREVDYVKTELKDAIKHGVSIEEKNNESENIDQEESKQTDIKEEIKKEDHKETTTQETQECLNSIKNIDNAKEKTESKTREVESLSSVSNTQEKSKEEDEAPKLGTLKIAEELQQKDGEAENNKESEPTVNEPARQSQSDLIQRVKGTNKSEDAATKPHIEEELKTEDEDEDGDEHKDKTSPDSIVIVEAKDTVNITKTQHKKSQGILSQVKHSISKVKKALTGKSSHTTKPSSPK